MDYLQAVQRACCACQNRRARWQSFNPSTAASLVVELWRMRFVSLIQLGKDWSARDGHGFVPISSSLLKVVPTADHWSRHPRRRSKRITLTLGFWPELIGISLNTQHVLTSILRCRQTSYSVGQLKPALKLEPSPNAWGDLGPPQQVQTLALASLLQ